MNIAESYYSLPTVQRFINLIVDQLRDGINLLVITPPWVDGKEVGYRIREQLWSPGSDLDVRSIDVRLDALDHEERPVETFAACLDITRHDPLALQTVSLLVDQIVDLIRERRLPQSSSSAKLAGGTGPAQELPDIVLLDGIEHVSLEQRSAWLAFLESWARNVRRAHDELRMALCAIVPGTAIPDVMPTTDVLYDVRWWWGFPSQLEIQLLCRMTSEATDSLELRQWREYLLPAIAGSDLVLVEALWSGIVDDNRSIEQSLRNYAEQHGWSRLLDPCTLGQIRQLQPNFAPPVQFPLLWRTGVLVSSPEYGVELHPAAAVAAGYLDALHHRMWRGQATYLLPLVDYIRRVICEDLTTKYGVGWPLRWDRPKSDWEVQAVTTSPMACELGYLDWLFWNSHPMREDGRRWRGLSSQAREVRNAIAHGKPVSYATYTNLCQSMTQHGIALPFAG